MMRKLIKTYDCPCTMISDNAQEFTSEAIKTLCASHGIRKLEVAPYHPNSNGLVERVTQKPVYSFLNASMFNADDVNIYLSQHLFNVAITKIDESIYIIYIIEYIIELNTL